MFYKKHRDVLCMYRICYIRGHVEVFDADGRFLFSADTVGEAREMLED